MYSEMLALRARVLALEAVLHALVRELAWHGPGLDPAALDRSRETARDLILRAGPPPHRVHVPEGVVDVASELADVVLSPKTPEARPSSRPCRMGETAFRPTSATSLRGIAPGGGDRCPANDR